MNQSTEHCANVIPFPMAPANAAEAEHRWYTYPHARAPGGEAKVCIRCGIVSVTGARTGPCLR